MKNQKLKHRVTEASIDTSIDKEDQVIDAQIPEMAPVTKKVSASPHRI